MTAENISVDLNIQHCLAGTKIPADEQFRLWVTAALEHRESGLACENYSLAIRIVDEQEGQRFNRDYRGGDYPTNVLSFPAELPAGLPSEVVDGQLGDLLICAPVVEREAQEQGKPEVSHWAHLTVHGVLHLLGFDHELSPEAEAMEALEVDILARLNIVDPYQSGL